MQANEAAAAGPRLQVDLPTFPHAVLAGQGQAVGSATPAEHPVDVLPSGVWIALQVSGAPWDRPGLARRLLQGILGQQGVTAVRNAQIHITRPACSHARAKALVLLVDGQSGSSLLRPCVCRQPSQGQRQG